MKTGRMFFLRVAMVAVISLVFMTSLSYGAWSIKVKPYGSVKAITVDIERMQRDLNWLSALSPSRSYLNPFSLNRAADHIRNGFRETGCRLDVQVFHVDGDLGRYKNIICSVGPVEGERIIIGAHYDVAQVESDAYQDPAFTAAGGAEAGVTADRRRPGADDNASGVAALMELARLLKQNEGDLKKRVDLVAYALEEPPFFRTENMGSAVHAKSLKEWKVDVGLMIALESIGFYSTEPGSQEYPSFILKPFYPDEGNFIAVVGKVSQMFTVRKVKKLMKRGSDINVQSLSAPTILAGVDFSDHMNYWKEGYRAVMITDTAFYRNPNYHTATDTVNTVNLGKMVEVVKGVYNVVINF